MLFRFDDAETRPPFRRAAFSLDLLRLLTRPHDHQIDGHRVAGVHRFTWLDRHILLPHRRFTWHVRHILLRSLPIRIDTSESKNN